MNKYQNISGLLFSLMLYNCATTYSPFLVEERYGKSIDDGVVCLKCGRTDLGYNKRINKNSEYQKIFPIQCTVKNNSKENVQLNFIKEQITTEIDTIKYLSPLETYKELALIENGYWLYALPIGIGVLISPQGIEAGFFITHPLSWGYGILSALFNWSKARKGNNAFKKNLLEYEMIDQDLEEEETITGLLFIKSKKRKEAEVILEYEHLGEKNKIILKGIRL